ncbi:hypothetical protein N474_11140 [Pseudoalteromonas luteoviolacea CPMOR-2]|uniref:Lcl C-terminal domain-containing protein n=1 Tax=Pseudoalteromonas luteoviolacea DSM 6061 TaxID=1365250 RepID=A0A166V9S7_9GAMM|nr:DUF1566 domain-containing protein [Pseudoalteromonas luteoviolacea]KZN32403.1 hypothetical protein N475_22235 [Pseudoalteromonas luteoviolacea DSM 6061]KZN56699.1 hypothetical protein N474_11140 [Pseudoalteromonas luteoviolacea CPMOR-2]MBE0386085.1 hypothetical protein [Pseudoalteromonas luteoviolacea DSM 6061]
MDKLIFVLGVLASGQVFASCNAESPIRFDKEANHILLDNKHRLMWMDCVIDPATKACLTDNQSSFSATAKQALEIATSATLEGHSNWRLPNIKELVSLFAHECEAENAKLVMQVPERLNYVWTSTTASNGNSAGLLVLSTVSTQITPWGLSRTGPAVLLVRDINQTVE